MSAPAQLPVVRARRPRLLWPVGDPAFAGGPATDPVRRRIVANLLEDCERFAARRPWRRIPRRPNSPHPYHQLYLTFYTGMQATALIEHYAFAWRLTGDRRWLGAARAWLRAAAAWEHDDRVEEHFYTANRYMHAIAVALDLLDDVLPSAERRAATACLVHLLERWWPDVDGGRSSTEGGHHAIVDNGHFGVAALHLLGEHPRAGEWVTAVVDRCRAAILPHGCGPAGEPVDGPTFWPWENLWLLQFADALRNVTGIDLSRECPARFRRPLTWFRAHWAPPRAIPDRRYYPGDANVLLGSQLNACAPALLRLAQDAGDGSLRDAALSDPRLGRLFRFGAGVKGSTAECMIAYAPWAYCWYDPDFRAATRAPSPPLARRFTARSGRSAVLRSGHGTDAAILCVSGYDGGPAHGFMDLHVQWQGHPLLRAIAAAEAQPVACGSLPCVGGQNEIVAVPGQPRAVPGGWLLPVAARRTQHEYWMLPGSHPILLVALRRRRRRARPDPSGELFRVDGDDALQYDGRRYFCANGGRLRLRLRLHRRGDGPWVLFNAGLGVAGVAGPGVNTLAVVVESDGTVSLRAQSQRAHEVRLRAPGRLRTGRWHDVDVAWGDFNRRGGRPWMAAGVDGRTRRLDDTDAFGEVGTDSIGLASRDTPRTFYLRPQSVIAFGGAVQTPGVGARLDLAAVDLSCPGRRRLRLGGPDGWGPETGSGELVYKLNPVALRNLRGRRARLGAGPQVVDLLALYGEDVGLRIEEVPFAPAGLAAGSLRSFLPDPARAATRLLASTEGDVLVLAFAASAATMRVESRTGGFRCRVGRGKWLAFEICEGRGPILRQRR